VVIDRSLFDGSRTPKEIDCFLHLKARVKRLAAGLGQAALRAVSGRRRRLGRLIAGWQADMVAFDPDDIRILGTWVAGGWMGTAFYPAG
jgi:hypothetical protein